MFHIPFTICRKYTLTTALQRNAKIHVALSGSQFLYLFCVAGSTPAQLQRNVKVLRSNPSHPQPQLSVDHPLQ